MYLTTFKRSGGGRISKDANVKTDRLWVRKDKSVAQSESVKVKHTGNKLCLVGMKTELNSENCYPLPFMSEVMPISM